MSKNVLAAGRWKKQAITDKVDMSLDDIIRLNRKEQQSRKKQLPGKRRQPVKNGRFPQRNPRYGAPGDGAAGPKGGGVLRGGVSKLKSKRILPQMARRRGQGVITGLASRRPTSFQRGFNPTNRAAYTQRMVPKTGLMTGLITGLTTGPTTGPRRGPTTGPRRGPTTGPRRGPTPGPKTGPMTGPRRGPMTGPRRGPMTGLMTGPRTGLMTGPRTGLRMGSRLGQRIGQRTRPFVQRIEAQFQRPELQRRLPRGVPTDHQMGGMPAGSLGSRPIQLRRRPLPAALQAQQDTRQATFLSHRGLKVHTQVLKQSPHATPVRARQWCNSTKSNGLLTVSIDNPTARTQPEPPTAWSLHPQPPAPVKLEPVEKKTPKGVPLQFDINSVAKPQTVMTLNERFRILKDQRATTQGNKGSRVVTVSQ